MIVIYFWHQALLNSSPLLGLESNGFGKILDYYVAANVLMRQKYLPLEKWWYVGCVSSITLSKGLYSEIISCCDNGFHAVCILAWTAIMPSSV